MLILIGIGKQYRADTDMYIADQWLRHLNFTVGNTQNHNYFVELLLSFLRVSFSTEMASACKSSNAHEHSEHRYIGIISLI